MNVVWHEAIRQNLHANSRDVIPQPIQIHRSISVAKEDLLLPMPRCVT